MQYDLTMGQEIVPKAPFVPAGGAGAAVGVESMAELVAGMMPPEADPYAPLPEPEYPTYTTPEGPSADREPGPAGGLKTAAIVGAALVVGYFAYKVLL